MTREKYAFPIPSGAFGDGREGMSLRQWYAGQVLPVCATGHYYGPLEDRPRMIAEQAFKIADAMIKAGAET